MEFFGIQIHNKLNRVTIESVITHQAKRSSYYVFSKKPITVAPTH